MTVQEVLQKPDSEIIRNGLFVKMIIREYRRITVKEPCYCDSQLTFYIKTVRDFHEKNTIFAP